MTQPSTWGWQSQIRLVRSLAELRFHLLHLPEPGSTPKAHSFAPLRCLVGDDQHLESSEAIAAQEMSVASKPVTVPRSVKSQSKAFTSFRRVKSRTNIISSGCTADSTAGGFSLLIACFAPRVWFRNLDPEHSWQKFTTFAICWFIETPLSHIVEVSLSCHKHVQCGTPPGQHRKSVLKDGGVDHSPLCVFLLRKSYMDRCHFDCV